MSISGVFAANGSLTAAGSSSATEMQHETSNGGDEKLATDHNGKVTVYANGGRAVAPLFLDKTDREIVRLIGQHLKIIGLE